MLGVCMQAQVDAKDYTYHPMERTDSVGVRALRVCANLPSNHNTQTPSKSAKAGARSAAIIVSVMLLVLCVVCVTAKTPAGSLFCFLLR